MFGADSQVKQRLDELEKHLVTESPLLVNAVEEFKKLDKVGYRMGLLAEDESYATQIPWWPLISVLGTFSAGKSTFINHYLNTPLQETGTQAVDDKFTVICYSAEQQARVLPGISLEADPRFPFYHMADVLEQVTPGASDRINTYMQMKTCTDIKSKGRIFIDSPGFDADDQRTETLKITDYIIDLSDLVLIFFDARHPEPGAMRDTLKHLVADKIYQKNADKFVYILNQIDAAVKEDNPEDVIASWQRALAAEGLTAGKFYTIYNPDAAVIIEDDTVRNRFEQKRDIDLNAINDRIEQMNIDRVYRIIGALDKSAREIEYEKLPLLISMISNWRRAVLSMDAIVIVVLGIIAAVSLMMDSFIAEMLISFGEWMSGSNGNQMAGVMVLFILFLSIHFSSRTFAINRQLNKLMNGNLSDEFKVSVKRAFEKNTVFFRSIFRPQVVGWGYFSKRIIKKVKNQADSFIQKLNDQYASPSGDIKLNTENEKKENVTVETINTEVA